MGQPDGTGMSSLYWYTTGKSDQSKEAALLEISIETCWLESPENKDKRGSLLQAVEARDMAGA